MSLPTHPSGFLHELLRLQPAPGSPRVAARASLTVLVALLVLWSVGRLDLALYATFGAFTSVYGGGRPTPGRWRLQAALGLVMTAAVASGALTALSPHRGWLSVPVAALWAGVAADLSDRYAWRPPGPLFTVFAVAACAAVPTTPAGLAPALGVAASTALLAVVLGAVEGAWTRRWPLPAPPPLPRYPAGRRRLHVVRCAVAVVVAGAVATVSGIGHPYWAMVASVVPLAGPTLRAQLLRGAHRAAGTMLGLVLAAGLLVVPLPTLALVLVAAVLQGATELLVVRNYGLALVFITGLALLLGQFAHPQPLGELLFDRLVQTLIGVLVGVGMVVVTHEGIRRRPA